MKCIPFYSPVTVCTMDPDDFEETPVAEISKEIADAINTAIINDAFNPYAGRDFNAIGLAAYNNIKGVLIIRNRVILNKPDDLICETLVFVNSDFEVNDESIDKIAEEISGQYSDGWGEGFEQTPIKMNGKEYYVHFWTWDNWHIKDALSLDEYLAKREMNNTENL